MISPFKSLNLLCWNSYLEYFVFNLFILDSLDYSVLDSDLVFI